MTFREQQIARRGDDATSRRAAAVVVVLSIHAALIWALMPEHLNLPPRPPPVLTTAILDPPRKPPQERPPPALRISPLVLAARPVELPGTTISFELSPEPAVEGAAASSGVDSDSTAPEHAGPTLIYKPDPHGYYPLESMRNHEVGDVLMNICLNADAKIVRLEVQRSRYPRLNEAAIRLALKTRWQAATTGGNPVAECSTFMVQFKDPKDSNR